jgi:diacylglycerol O-acyltransferase/trehalose O-mycolyltransferase
MRFKGLQLVVLSVLFSGLIATPASAQKDTSIVVSQHAITDRLLELRVNSDALHQEVGVRLLLPESWKKFPHRRWPTLYLLHGCCGGDAGFRSWTENTDVAAFTANTDVLIVMPEAGTVGFYSNWYNAGAGGAPAWETFHLTELRRLLEQKYRSGRQRAVAGLSMGGFGALSYSARHPGFFRSAASYSGVVSTTYQGPRSTDLVQSWLVNAGFDKNALWGDPVAQSDIWSAHNPFDLAVGLRCIPVFVSVGNGQAGPFDPPGNGVDPLEQWLNEETDQMVDHLRAEHVSVTTDFYGPGTHSWPYWQRELHKSFPMLMHSIGVAL